MHPLLVGILVFLALFSLSRSKENQETFQLFGATTACVGAIFLDLDLVEVFHWFFVFVLLLDAIWHFSHHPSSKQLIVIGSDYGNLSLSPTSYLIEPSTHWVVIFYDEKTQKLRFTHAFGKRLELDGIRKISLDDDAEGSAVFQKLPAMGFPAIRSRKDYGVVGGKPFAVSGVFQADEALQIACRIASIKSFADVLSLSVFGVVTWLVLGYFLLFSCAWLLFNLYESDPNHHPIDFLFRHPDFVMGLYIIHNFHEREIGLRRLLLKTQPGGSSPGALVVQGFLSVGLCVFLRGILVEGVFPLVLMGLSVFFYHTLRGLHAKTFQVKV